MGKCPRCGSGDIKKNGHIHNGKQNYYCKDCGRNFVANPEQRIVSERDRELATRLIGEGMSMRAISRVLDVSLPWVLSLARGLFKANDKDFGQSSITDSNNQDT